MAASPLSLFWSFAKVGTVGYGGGPSMIPLVQAEVVDRHHWLTEAEFVDVLAAGNALPGPIATKMAVYVGYHAAGVVGAAAGLLGMLLPSTVLMLTLAGILTKWSDHPRVAGALSGVRPVVVAMLAWVVVELAPSGVQGWTGGALVVAAIVLMALKVHPAWLIVGAALFGGLFLAR